MANTVFLIGLTLLTGGFIWWGCKTLPAERWQILAAVPTRKTDQGWRGMNLTYYGFFMATSTLVAALIFTILAASLPIPLPAAFVMIVLVLALCFPAARIVAILVEGKRDTFTVGGASFVGVMVSPFVISLVSWAWGPLAATGDTIPVMPVLAAVSTAYCFGEGLGRLACISFGCCYGKPIEECHPFVRRLFSRHHFVFSGHTKKIAYAHGLEGQQVLPIQAITAVLLSATGIAGTALFLGGFFSPAFLVTLAVSQVWRFASEFFRADFRGKGKISAYQIMGLLSVGYAFTLAFILPEAPRGGADIVSGLRSLWDPAPILAIQAIWAAVFLYSGRSTVTGSSISFYVVGDRV